MKRYMTILTGLLGFALLVSAPTAHAQTLCPNPCTLTVNQTYSVLWDHDGINVTGYRLYVDGVARPDIPLSALQSGTVTVSGLAAGARGPHTLQFAAFNEDWETKSDLLTFGVKKTPPGKPTNPRIMTITLALATDGTVSVKIAGAEKIGRVDFVKAK